MKTNGMVAGEPVNTPSEKPVRTRSRFPSLSYHFYNSERFGENGVCFVMDCVEGDKVPVRSGGHVSSYTLKAPLMQSISKKKDFYMVPMEAILMQNWKKFYTNPVVGDDVPDACGTSSDDFWIAASALVSAMFSQCATDLAATPVHLATISNSIFRTLIVAEMFYSNGSLIKSLGASGAHYCSIKTSKKRYTIDSFIDLVVADYISIVPYFEFYHDGHAYKVVNDEANYGYMRDSQAVVSMRTFLQMMRDDLTTYVSDVPTSVQSAFLAGLTDYFDTSKYSRSFATPEVPYDLRRLWAYQLVNAHFYTNDHIDYVYSSDIFRQLIDYFVFTQYDGTYQVPHFTLNGIQCPYDSTSAYCFDIVMSNAENYAQQICHVTTGVTASHKFYKNILGYLSALLSYRRSLRYVDYFTGSRSRPLAVGDVDVNVSSNKVNVVDVSRNIQRQRFFNAVNRFGRRFEEYIKGLSGVTPDTDYHNPLYLGHTSDTVYGVETENTGTYQMSRGNSVTTRLQTNGSRYQFEFDVDRPCVVIGITYYDMPRAYLFATERQLFHVNRFDMFNPYMQFIGDQDVRKEELGQDYYLSTPGTFGYQMRHMEYKQRYDQAAGAFVEDLPGFLFTDRVFGHLSNFEIDPHFIRSLNSELDEFYVALTGYSLGHYFHFIVDNDNVCDASRPMAFAPSIL